MSGIINRYQLIDKNYQGNYIADERELTLLKSYPCSYGKCSFCDYHLDNSIKTEDMVKTNREFLNKVTGEKRVLEVINSGSFFELPLPSAIDVKKVIKNRSIDVLYLEFIEEYRESLPDLQELLGEVEIRPRIGIETFDREFREKIFRKVIKSSLQTLSETYFSVCLLIGVKGQSREMIEKDIDTALKNFKGVTINIFKKNSTHFEEDRELAEWFLANFEWLKEYHADIFFDHMDFS